jgi:uncharacterized protein YidB (DUF937 family)
MNFLETLAGSLMETDDKTDQKLKLDMGQVSRLVSALAGMVSKIGFPALIKMFDDAGLDDIIKSWIGKGKNKAISAPQMESALGPKIIGELAKKAGINTSVASSALAVYLPKIIDGLSPDGKADDGLVKKEVQNSGLDLGSMANLLGSFLKK